MQHVTVYQEAGRYAGWPANYGIWAWDDEIVLVFIVGHVLAGVPFHARDKDQPFVTVQARSRDGGKTWETQPFPGRAPGGRGLSADEHMNPPLQIAPLLESGGDVEDAPGPPPGNIDFTHPHFALMCARTGLRAGARSWFYTSTDRCRSWDGPYALPDFGQTGIAARTDYVVLGPRECLFLLTAAKPDGGEGRVFCARTRDGGETFEFLSWVTPDPGDGYTIMPASVRLPSGRILTAVRCRGGDSSATSGCWIDLYASDDAGETWQYVNQPVPDSGRGGNPPTLTLLRDGRLCMTYGFRDAPFGMRALLSADGGESWGEPIVLRDGAGNHDLGYPRTVQLGDDTMVTAYYYNEDADGDRTIEATLWQP